MLFLRFKPGAAKWKAQRDPLSYGGTPGSVVMTVKIVNTGSTT